MSDNYVKESLLNKTTQTILKYVTSRTITTDQLADKDKVDTIVLDDTGTKYLNNAGMYKTLAASEIKETTSKKIMTLAERNKVGKIIIDSDGTKFLCDDGTYKEIESMEAITEDEINLLFAKEEITE